MRSPSKNLRRPTKRPRFYEEGEDESAGLRASTSLLTPPRELQPPALDPCCLGVLRPSRSPSICTSATEGISEDSMFLLDLSGANRGPRGSSGSAAATSRGHEEDAAQWQAELNDFFAKLDQRSLNVTH